MTIHTTRPLDPETLGRTFVDVAWNDTDDDRLERLCSPTLVVHDPANPTTGTGLNAYRQFVSRVTDGATRVEMAVDYVFVADGKIAIHSSGTLRKSPDLEGAEVETALSAFEVIHIEDDRIVEWAGTALADRTLREFLDGFAGEMVCPDDADYHEVRAVWNGVIDRYPGLILRCSGVADVINAVNFTREHDLLVSVRSGGHNVAGSAVCDGGVVIDLSAMRGVWVDPDERTAWVQAGATLGDVDRETQMFGLATPLGVVSATGVAGLTLGGGLGHLRNKYGSSSDNLASVDIVTPDGEYRTASESENADLFWGLRGGGGDFGVVTGFEFDLHPVGPEVATVLVIYDGDDGEQVMHGFREYNESPPDEISVLASLGIMPDEDLFPTEIVHELKIGIVGMYAGSPAEGEPVIEPLRRLAEPLVDFSSTMPYTDFQRAFDADYPDGMRYYWKSLYLESLSDEIIDRIVEWGHAAPSPLSTVDVWALGGALADVGPEDSAFPGRGAPYLLAVEANWEQPEDDEANVKWTRDFLEDMQPYSDGSVYLNFPGFHEGGTDTMKRTFGDAYHRLIATKTAYDPENRLRVNQNIQPLIEEGPR